jgi:DnaK suppressor protein
MTATVRSTTLDTLMAWLDGRRLAEQTETSRRSVEEDGQMDKQRAKALLDAERARVENLLKETGAAGQEDRATANEGVAIDDPAERLTAEEVDDALVEGLRDRLAALDRAERRVEEGTYGRSVRTGAPIPDDRLEADPAAELTAAEAEQA